MSGKIQLGNKYTLYTMTDIDRALNKKMSRLLYG